MFESVASLSAPDQVSQILDHASLLTIHPTPVPKWEHPRCPRRQPTASQDLETEEDEIATRHVRFKTWHSRPVYGREFGPSSGLERLECEVWPRVRSRSHRLISQPPSSSPNLRLQTGEPEPVLNVIGTPVLPYHPLAPAPIPTPPSPAATLEKKTRNPAAPALSNVNEEFIAFTCSSPAGGTAAVPVRERDQGDRV
jgi:hypothetical protein